MMKLSNLKPLTWIVTIMVALQTVPSVLVAGSVILYPDFFRTYIAPIATEFDLYAIALKVLTMIVFSIWIYQAGRNLVRAGYEDLEFSPASRIWWFAVPIATLFKPYQGMRELWNASHGELEYTITVPLVATWWALWLLDNLLNRFFSGVSANILPLVAGADVGLAIVAALMLHSIAEAQRRLSPSLVAEVFA